MCCAPCSVYPIGILENEGIKFEGFFYNPNIHPIDEFNRRKENVEKLAGIKNFNVHYSDEFKQDVWKSLRDIGDKRCNMCYTMRLEKAAAFAAANGFDAFTTTLLVSPYQKHELIKEIGEKFSQKYGVDFYYMDFRPGFRQGQQQAKEMGLYRQKFCGCILSFNEAQERKKHK